MNRRYGMTSMGGDWRDPVGSERAAANAKHQNEYISKTMRKWDKDKRAQPPPPIALRPMVIDDASYVLDSWSNSYRRSPTTGPIERQIFNIEQRARINRLITRPRARVLVACLQSDRESIVGWICFEAPLGDQELPIVHYVCVKPANQLQGIGTALIKCAQKTAYDPSLPMWATHETAPMRHIREKWNLLFNPYLLELPDKAASVKLKDLPSEPNELP